MMYLQEHAKIILYKEAILETASSSKRTQKDPTLLNQHIRSAFFFFHHKLKFFLLLWKGCLEHIKCCYSNFHNTYKNSAILATQGVFVFGSKNRDRISWC